MALQPLINGTAYSWSQIAITIGGRPLTDVTAISYTVTQEKTNNYGIGNQPTSRGRGRKEYEASITLRLGELEAIRNSVLSRDILDIAPFNITVSFLPEDGTLPVNHILKNAEFTANPVDVSEGDTSIELEIPLIIAGVDYLL